MGTLYKNILKPILFSFPPELIHELITTTGEFLGQHSICIFITNKLFFYKDNSLEQEILGIKFKNPIGLAAGFDYDARLTQILPSVGFGFQSVGTITNSAYGGNPPPMLGRLPKSKSLMVNKGFKNIGVKNISKNLKSLNFKTPLGISIGRTNSLKLKTQKQSVLDIISAFKVAEKSKLKNSYYELNISCPNLFGEITFYPPKNLEDLLTAIDKLELSKPLFIKMPIEKSDKEIKQMLKVIAKHKVEGVIFGNLQKNRKDPALYQDEVEKFDVGNFSGKPTFKRSNELIKLAYSLYGKKLIIIGCGGVFSASDAYIKIKLGASLVQMITGMIYEGPQLIGDINKGLAELLEVDGFKNISEAIGVDLRPPASVGHS